MRTLLAVLLSIGLVLSAHARELTEEERGGLETRLSDYRSALDERNAEFMVEVTPPRILEITAEKLGLEAKDLRDKMIGQITDMLTGASAFTFELDTAAMRVRETPAGTPYVLIPTKTELRTDETGTIRTESTTIAFMADGKWWLAGTQGPGTAAVLVEAYPELEGISIPEPKMSVGK